MSGTYLYCQNPECGEYLGSLGGDSCHHCGWRSGEQARRFDDDWAPNPNDDQGALGVDSREEALRRAGAAGLDPDSDVVGDGVAVAPPRCTDCNLPNGCPEYCRCYPTPTRGVGGTDGR